MNARIILLLTLFFIQVNSIYTIEPFNKIFTDKVYKKSIKSVILHKEGDKLSYPVIFLGSDDRILVSFDDFSDNLQEYQYEIIHCNMDWKASDLFKIDYLEGFQQDKIDNYKYSINTTKPYIHYELVFPNEFMKPLISGNYVIRVFEEETGNTIFERRFFIVDPMTEIDAEIKQSTEPGFKSNSQEINFTLHYDPTIYNPRQNIITKVSQNSPWSSIRTYKPTFMDHEKLTYDFQDENIFPGGSEFRNFDLKNIRYLSPEIERIEYNPPYFYVYLHPDEASYNKPYFYDRDLNGKRRIEIEGKDPDVEADYSYVMFRLKSKPLFEGSVHVYGELTGWQINEENRMNYNFDTDEYEVSLLVKQGYYNYSYMFVDSHTGNYDVGAIDGSYHETENDYLVFVYYKDISTKYDRLVGFSTFNSLR